MGGRKHETTLAETQTRAKTLGHDYCIQQNLSGSNTDG